jgi:hypothetical protein
MLRMRQNKKEQVYGHLPLSTSISKSVHVTKGNITCSYFLLNFSDCYVKFTLKVTRHHTEMIDISVTRKHASDRSFL